MCHPARPHAARTLHLQHKLRPGMVDFKLPERDPTLVTVAYRRQRLYLFTRHEPNDAEDASVGGGGGRVVLVVCLVQQRGWGCWNRTGPWFKGAVNPGQCDHCSSTAAHLCHPWLMSRRCRLCVCVYMCVYTRVPAPPSIVAVCTLPPAPQAARDVFNEKPSVDEMLAADGMGGGASALPRGACMHTTKVLGVCVGRGGGGQWQACMCVCAQAGHAVVHVCTHVHTPYVTTCLPPSLLRLPHACRPTLRQCAIRATCCCASSRTSARALWRTSPRMPAMATTMASYFTASSRALCYRLEIRWVRQEGAGRLGFCDLVKLGLAGPRTCVCVCVCVYSCDVLMCAHSCCKQERAARACTDAQGTL